MNKEIRPIYRLSPRQPSQIKRCTQTKSKVLERRHFMQTEKKRKAGVAILISNKIDFKTKVMVRDKEGHNIMIKGTMNKRI